MCWCVYLSYLKKFYILVFGHFTTSTALVQSIQMLTCTHSDHMHTQCKHVLAHTDANIYMNRAFICK